MCLLHTIGAAVGPLITGLLSSKEVSIVYTYLYIIARYIATMCVQVLKLDFLDIRLKFTSIQNPLE